MKAALLRQPGPVESAQAGARAAAELIADLAHGNGAELHHRLEAVELAFGVEGRRAFLRAVQVALVEACE